jgi:hypothetical protein
VGWALSNPDYQYCDGCGARLMIRNANVKYDEDLRALGYSRREEKIELEDTVDKVVPQYLL